MTRSVSEKVCPECGTEVAADILVCDCGHAFPDGSDALPAEGANPESPEEGLFAAYLTARVEQAREALDKVRDELAEEPSDLSKAMEVMEAVQSLRIARAELDARLGRPSAYADAIRDRPSEEFRAEQSARAQRIAEDVAGESSDLPPPFRRSAGDAQEAPAPKTKRRGT